MSWDSSVWARLQRAAMTGFLLWVMVLGLRARPLALTSRPSSVAPALTLMLAALCTAAAASLIALALHHPRRSRDRMPEHVLQIPFTRWDRLRALSVAMVGLLTLTLVLWAAMQLPGSGTSSELGTPTPAPSGLTTGTSALSVPSTSMWLSAVLVVLCLLAAARLILRSVLRRRAVVDLPASPAPVSAQPERARSWQPRSGGDAREDVVTAFRAFEEGAARLGVPVDPPETAVDIAQHPVTVRAADPDAIAELTALFHRARYSSTTITDAELDRAQDLLARIRGQLGGSS